MIRLSPRETEALALYVKLGRWTLVSEEMGVSIRTVKDHRSGAMRKLGAANSVQLVRAAIERGLVDRNSRKDENL